jgi:hypothetical protein
MSYAAAILIVVLSAALAAGASFLVDRLVRLDARRRNHEIGGQVFQLIGVMFSVMLAFVFSEVWSEYNTAAQAIRSECGALHGAAMLANALPDKMGRPVNRALLSYANEVTNVEWPKMAKERRSLEAAEGLRSALDVVARLDVTRPVDVSTHGQILALLAQAHAQRETRVFQLTLGLPPAMWFVLIALALVLTAFVVLSGTEGAGTMIFACSFTGAIAAVLVLVRMLDYPFEGALALGNTDFVKLGEQISHLLAAS